jgi:hypothetical protein
MRDIVEFGDRKFLLYRTIREFEKLDPNILKEYWYCDTTLKKDNIYYFCNEIKDIEYEEINTGDGDATPN